jgi:ATP-dependent helicase/nuclease subunit A
MSSAPSELKNIVVRAGAGAGKTTELTERVISLAQSFQKKHQRFPRLMVTTFTRKATQELKERLLKKAIEMEDLSLIRFVKSPSRLHISTIHGILSLFLNKYGTTIGLSPRFTIISAHKNHILIKKKIREICEKDQKFNMSFQILLEGAEFSDLIEAFSLFAAHQVEFPELHPATSADFAKILEQRSDALLSEINEYVQEIRREKLPETWQGLASYFEGYLQMLQDGSEISDWSKFWFDVDQGIPSVRRAKEMSEIWVEKRKKIAAEISLLTDWNCQKSYWQEHENWSREFAYCAGLLFEEIYQEKIRRAELTMQDLESISLRLIRQNPEAASSFAKTCDYWFIDEYQDTSPIQVELIKALSHSRPSFIVGDPQQSIYLFRGARSEVFTEQEDHVKAQGGELLEKMINYRSEPELLEFFNYFFSRLGPQFKPMTAKSLVLAKSQIPVAEIMIAPDDLEDKSRDPELDAVILRCQELIEQGAHPEEICVLSRNNQDLDQMALLAKKYQLPVQKHSSGQFFQRREILDANCLLKFLCNPHDNKNLIEILRTPAFYVDDQKIYEMSQSLGELISNRSFWNHFKEIDSENIQRLALALQETRSQGIGFTWRKLLIEKGFFNACHQMDPSGQREANLWKMVHLILSKERMPGFSHLDFLHNLDLSSTNTEEQDQGDGVPVIEPSKVHLMTVHASKGLQFDHVIFSRLGNDIPSPKVQFYMMDENSKCWTLAPMDPEEGKKVASLVGREILKLEKERAQAESDRILYVALTRAKRSVSLIMSEKFDSRSWAARWPLEKVEGLHETEKFSYRVRREKLIPRMMPEPKIENKTPKQKFVSPQANLRQSVSVTGILEQKSNSLSGSEKKQQDVEAGVDAIEKAMGGVEIHRLFESLKYYGLADAQFNWQSLLPKLNEVQSKALQFLAKDRNGIWLDLIKSGEVEDGIAVMKKPFLIQGQIDLWGYDDKGQAWVVDYKTGSERYQEKAFSQLEIYTWALKKMKKIKPTDRVQLAVIYPLSGSSYIQQSMDFQKAESWVSSLI